MYTRLDHITVSELETKKVRCLSIPNIYTAMKTKRKTFQKYRNGFF